MKVAWAEFVSRHRERHGLTQAQLAAQLGVSQRTVSRWERGEDNPNAAVQLRLRELTRIPDSKMLHNLKLSIIHCPAPRALSRAIGLRLETLSPAAVAKRPSIVEWRGHSLIPIATSILQTMLEDRDLQRAIARHEIAVVTTTTRSVLRTAESDGIGTFRTTISYFQADGVVFGDAISTPAPHDEPLGYRAISFDEIHSAHA